MVLVMTLIGVPLLGMIVYNYRLVEMSNSIKRSEYENEMAMDIISRIVRETVINAISEAKNGATEGVNELAELQRTNYSSTQGKFVALWINEYNLWESGGSPNDEVLGNFLNRLKDESGKSTDADIRSWWSGCENSYKERLKTEEKESYVLEMSDEELNGISSGSLSNEENELVGVLVDNETGIIDEDALNAAYNTIFKGKYQSYIRNNIVSKVMVRGEYADIISVDNIDVSGSGDFPTGDNYLKIEKPAVRVAGGFGDSLEIDAKT